MKGFIFLFLFIFFFSFFFVKNQNEIFYRFNLVFFRFFNKNLMVRKGNILSYNIFYLIIVLFLFIFPLSFIYSHEVYLKRVPFIILILYIIVMLEGIRKLNFYNYIVENGFIFSLLFFFMEILILFFRSITLFIRILINLLIGHILGMGFYYIFLIYGIDYWVFFIMFIGLYEVIIIFVQIFVLVTLLLHYLDE